MNNVVIVALPEQDDRVWKLSSEKKPHLTMLFLGEADKIADVEGVVQFVQHAVGVSEHGPFMLEVDHRDELGPDKADVLFFRKGRNARWIDSLRSQLLQNSSIRSAYESTEQYPEWMPHLTMGYPEAPAKEDDRDYPIGWVSFDRIAVWTGDYDGPEFRLEWPEHFDEIDSVGWSASDEARAILSNEALAHHGVKGMRWGQTKTEVITSGNGKTKMVTPKKAAKLDAKWEKNQFTFPKGLERYNAMASHVNDGLPTLNRKYEKDDFSKEPHEYPDHWSPRYREYNKDYVALQESAFRKAVTEVHGTSPSGKLKMTVEMHPDGEGMSMVVRDNQVEHSDTPIIDEVFSFKLTRNAKGLITKTETVGGTMSDDAEHQIELGAEWLQHHGVKGMKWGVRNKSNSLSAHLEKKSAEAEAKRRENRTPQDVRVHDTIGSSKRKKTKIEGKGGEDHPATEDALKVAAAQQKLKKSGVHALTNDELREVANRLNLEQQVANLSGGQKTAGQRFTEGLLGRGSKEDRKGVENKVGNAAREAATPYVKKEAAKRAAPLVKKLVKPI